MRKYFIVSLCRNGILGGGITMDSESMTYHTGKLTVPEEYRRLEMKYKEICALIPGWLFIFSTVLVKMRNGAEYKFVVFGRKRFFSMLKEMGVRG